MFMFIRKIHTVDLSSFLTNTHTIPHMIPHIAGLGRIRNFKEGGEIEYISNPSYQLENMNGKLSYLQENKESVTSEPGTE